ncbi:hypothetical protein K438DRAFT_1760955 [Mycena galopus ATCC 62051]|nr:hypothetical protein K438DRAFT_1760955 [Mycena galopus ATCC 62051]
MTLRIFKSVYSEMARTTILSVWRICRKWVGRVGRIWGGECGNKELQRGAIAKEWRVVRAGVSAEEGGAGGDEGHRHGLQPHASESTSTLETIHTFSRGAARSPMGVGVGQGVLPIRGIGDTASRRRRWVGRGKGSGGRGRGRSRRIVAELESDEYSKIGKDRTARSPEGEHVGVVHGGGGAPGGKCGEAEERRSRILSDGKDSGS